MCHSHSYSVRSGCHPYLRHNASRKAPLCNVNPNSAMGRAVSQLDAPFSWARAMDLWREAERVGWSRLADSFSCERLRLWISALALCCSSRALGETVGIFSEIRVLKGPAIFREAENSPEQRFKGSLKPRRGSRGGEGGGALGAEAPPPLELQVLRHRLRIRSFVR